MHFVVGPQRLREGHGVDAEDATHNLQKQIHKA